MSEDWIKMRSDIYRDPKVSVIAEHLADRDGTLARYVNQMCQRDMTVTRNVMRNVTVGALVSIWGVMRQRGKRQNYDLLCDGVTVSVLDDIADLPGIGEAMESAGWVEATDEGIAFRNFFQGYNVDPKEKNDSSAAERQRRYRERKAAEKVTPEQSDASNVTRYVTVTPREEKRREETNTPKTLKGVTEGFDQFWAAYPSKVGKGAALKAFEKIKPSQDLLRDILSALADQKQGVRWLKDGGQFIPNPATWLNQQRWLDGSDEPRSSGGLNLVGAI